MSNCLCCGKPLRKDTASLWHNSCIKRFFGTNTIPELDISPETLREIAVESTNKGYTIPGVQKKMSLHLTQGDTPRLTLVNYPSGYILKPQADEYRALPELENLIMKMAKASGIKTVPNSLLIFTPEKDSIAYITKRIDRDNGNCFAMEDFCQLDERLTEDKYKGSYERCAKIIDRFSCKPGLDLSELFLRLVFSFAVGNSDMHLKNFSLIETEYGSGEYELSAAYDLLSTNIVIPADTEQMALTLNGKKQNIRRKDFLIYAENIGIEKKAAEKMIAGIVKMKAEYTEMISDSYIPQDMKESLAELLEKRLSVLEEKGSTD